ncbi:type II toxin-antitoxin system RelE/ParE family toxin [Micrococcus sp. H39-S4]|nr:type II toxin-antitoxin system RelE/ParE family toxin [Micrococcus sp. H39-S4]MCZ4071505.1 type II toxin-antitoxin system RelE/ParE family toxin [Micrococcus sp. H39-S4]
MILTVPLGTAYTDHLTRPRFLLAFQQSLTTTFASKPGPTLDRPLVDTLTGSRHKNLKELHPGSSGRSEIRILFAFDPRRQAILLVAGDKAGAWKKWYATNIPLAEERLDAHLHALRSTPPGA